MSITYIQQNLFRLSFLQKLQYFFIAIQNTETTEKHSKQIKGNRIPHYKIAQQRQSEPSATDLLRVDAC